MPAEKAHSDGKTAPSHWFHILPQGQASARDLHAVRLAEKAWSQGDRVCIAVDRVDHAQALDLLLWQIQPEAFIPHTVVSDSALRCPDPVGILLCEPAADEWDTVIVLTQKLPADADRFSRLALIAHNEKAVLDQARQHFRQLRTLGIEPRVVDRRPKS